MNFQFRYSWPRSLPKLFLKSLHLSLLLSKTLPQRATFDLKKVEVQEDNMVLEWVEVWWISDRRLERWNIPCMSGRKWRTRGEVAAQILRRKRAQTDRSKDTCSVWTCQMVEDCRLKSNLWPDQSLFCSIGDKLETGLTKRRVMRTRRGRKIGVSCRGLSVEGCLLSNASQPLLIWLLWELLMGATKFQL